MLCKNSLLLVTIAVGSAASSNGPVLDAWKRNPHEYANATGSEEVSGYNYTKVYPGSRIDGWTIAYSVISRQLNDSLAATAFSVNYTPPDSLPIRKESDSWLSCNRYVLLEDKLDDRTTVDPDCHGIVSDSCRFALSKMAESSEVCRNDNIPEECDDEFMKIHTDPFMTKAGGTVFSEWFDFQTHGTGDFGRYDTLLRSVLITVTGVAPFPGSDFQDERLQGSLACVSANTVKKGSRVPPKKEKPADDEEDQPVNDGDSNKEDPAQGAASGLKLSFAHVAALMATALIANWV